MLHFDSDYMEGCHPRILKRLGEGNLLKQPGYGLDEISQSAREKIRTACGSPEAEIHFLVGGTQTNALVIRSLLGLCDGVIAATTGHVSVHEAGAIEATGHKVIELPGEQAKLSAKTVEAYMERFYADETWQHMVRPGMVYISHPTEYGTLYTKAELAALRQVCDKYHMYLYMDGARLGYALSAEHTDVTLPDIARYCHGFYIGGTKVGCLMGEALVFPKPLREGLFSIIKQSGAMLAKGWLLGLQFDTMFTDNLYLSCGRQGIEAAMELKRGMLEKGYSLYMDSPTNQQFVILPNEKIQELKKNVSFSLWDAVDETHTVARFVTSWATTHEQVQSLLQLL